MLIRGSCTTVDKYQLVNAILWVSLSLCQVPRTAVDLGVVSDLNDLYTGIGGAVRDKYCELYNGYSNYMDRTIGVNLSDNPLTGSIPAIVCGSPGGNPENPIENPPTGGQCDTRYNVIMGFRFASSVLCASDPPPEFAPGVQGTFWGPIGGPTMVGATSSYCTNGKTTYAAARITHFGSGSSPASSVQTSDFRAGSGDIIFSIFGVQFVRADGQPDDCGDPDPVPFNDAPTVDDRSIDISYEIDIDNGPNIPITIPVVYNDVDVNANADIDINVDVGGVKVGVNLRTGDLTFNFGGEGQQGDPVDDDGPFEPDPEGPDVLCGVRIQSSVIPNSYKQIGLGGGENIYYMPRLGSFHWLFSVDGQTLQGPEIQINKADEFHTPPCGCFCVSGFALYRGPGVVWSGIPYYGSSDCGQS